MSDICNGGPWTYLSTSAPNVSFYSSTNGPFAAAGIYTWVQHVQPVTVGTVQVTVNKADNRTVSNTVYHTDFNVNGSQQLLTRTDTDARGTVTKVIDGNYTVYARLYSDTDLCLTLLTRWLEPILHHTLIKI